MHIFFFAANTVCYAGQSATGKLYAAKGGQANSFNLCKAGSAVILFFVWLLIKGNGIHWSTLPWALLYGLCLTVSMYTGFMALSCGPMALTSIMAAMSLLIPFLWGILFWQEQLSVFGIFGILLLIGAIVLINYRKESRFSKKWLVYSLITMVTNGFCSVIQKYHQLTYPKLYQVDFMLLSMAAVTLLLLIAFPFQKEKKLRFSGLGTCSGIMNGLANFFVLILAGSKNAAALFPMVSVCNVMAAWLTGILFFKEKTKTIQFVGLILGVASVCLLNLL